MASYSKNDLNPSETKFKAVEIRENRGSSKQLSAVFLQFYYSTLGIHSKSEKVCGIAFSVKKKLRKKCVNPGVIFGPFGVILGNFWAILDHFGSF